MVGGVKTSFCTSLFHIPFNLSLQSDSNTEKLDSVRKQDIAWLGLSKLKQAEYDKAIGQMDSIRTIN